MMRRDRLQTMAKAFSDICQEEDSWVALGNFMNYWFDYAKEQRQQLVADPLPEYEPLPELHRWAALCAASVEWLCHKYGEVCPQWVYDPKYTLKRRWYYSINAHHKHVQAWLRQTTPEEFARRNIYCGNRVYANKWEMAEQFKAFRAAKQEREQQRRIC